MNSVIAHKGFITFLIISGIVFTTLIGFNLINKTQAFKTNASEGEDEPIVINTTNITQTTAQISWTTKSESTGTIVYSINPEYCELVFDENSCIEVNTQAEPSASHIVDVSNLASNTLYYYKIRSQKGKYYPEGEPITFKTLNTEEAEDTKNNTYYVRKYTGPDYFGIIPDEINKIIDKAINGENQEQDSQDNQTNDNLNSDNGNPNEETRTETSTQTDQNTQINEQQETEATDNETQNNEEDPDVLGISTSNFVNELVAEEFYTAVKYGDKKYDFNKDGEVTFEDYPLFIEFINSKD